jgi:hypothetical protein
MTTTGESNQTIISIYPELDGEIRELRPFGSPQVICQQDVRDYRERRWGASGRLDSRASRFADFISPESAEIWNHIGGNCFHAESMK